MKPVISKEFIFEYFRGKATSMQKQLIESWIKSPENEETFYLYLEEWERLHPQYLVDVGQGINGFRSSLSGAGPESGQPLQARGKTRTIWLWAASLALALTALGWVYHKPLLYASYQTRPGEVKPYTLPDGSLVTLNANSRLSVPRLWKFYREREVFLSGEAEFKVTRKKTGQKFTVKTGNNVDIVVLGTIFTVFNRHKRTTVILNEGKVKLTRHLGDSTRSIHMVPGDKVLVEAGKPLVFDNVKDTAKTTLWKENRFEFDQTSLKEISRLLKDHYDLKVAFDDPDIQTRTHTGSFVAVNADEFLESICLMNGLRYRKSGQIVNFFKEDL